MARSRARRSSGRGAADFLRVLLRFVPPDARDEVREVWAQGRRLDELEGVERNDIDIFLKVLRQTKKEWDLVEEELR